MFPSDRNSSCIDFSILDDEIALEPPEMFTWTIGPILLDGVELSMHTTTITIIDDDSKLKQSLQRCAQYTLFFIQF